MLKEKNLQKKYLLLAILIVLLVFVPYFFLNDGLFVFYGDFYEQQIKFYMQGWTRVHNGSLPYWDWSSFLGNNYFGSNTFYFLGSPFYWLAMLVPSKEMIPYMFLPLNLLKSILCVLFSYMWLHEFTDDDLGASVGALIVTFSGFVLTNYSNNHMLDAIVFMPLILYFVEKYLKDNKFVGVVLSIGYLGIVNYYFLYIFIPFLCLYVLFRYFSLNNKIIFKNISLKALGFIGCLILGLMICMVTLLPTMEALKGNTRAADLQIGFNTIGKYNLYRFITSFINPVNDWRLNANLFIDVSIDPGIGWVGGMTNYSLIITVLLFIPLITLYKKREIRCIFPLYICYFLFALFPMFYVLFNQNYETRWMLLYPVINALMVAFVLSNRKDINWKTWSISGIVVILFMIGCLFITYKLNLCPESWAFNIIKRNVLVLSILIVIYVINFAWLKKELVVIILVGIEVLFVIYNCFYNMDIYNKPMDKDDLKALGLFDSKIVDYLKEYDKNFYRIDIGELNVAGLNDGVSKGYNSFNSYHSVLNNNQQKFIQGRFARRNQWFIDPQSKVTLKTLLGSKYWYSYAESGISNKYGETSNIKDDVPYGYDYLTSIDGIDIYKNRYALSFAYVQEKEINIDYFNELSILAQDLILNEYVATNLSDNQDINLMTKIKELISDEVGNYDLSEYENGLLYLLLDNDRTLYYSKNYIDGTGIMGSTKDDLGYSTLNIDGRLDHIWQDNEAVKIYYDDMHWYDVWYFNKLKQAAYDVYFTDNLIGGKINVFKDNSWVVTSIPYYKGWEVKCDDQLIDYYNINNGFIGIKLNKGIHDISFSFVPPMFRFGLLITFVSFSLTLILGFIYYRKGQKGN